MQVRQLMSHPTRTCKRTDSLRTAARLMWDHDLGFLPVVDARGLVVGVVTDRDLAMACYLKGRGLEAIPVGEVMSMNVASCTPDTDALEAEQLMRSRSVRRLPVVSSHGRLEGVISVGDLARSAIGHKRHDGVRTSEVIGVLASVSSPRKHGEPGHTH